VTPTLRSLALGAWLATLVGGCASTDERPVDGADRGDPAGRWHEVAPGDTLWSIARASDLTVEEIAEVNGLSQTDHLVPGQLLFLPSAEPTDTRPAPRDTRVATEAAVAEGGLSWPMERGVLLRVFAPEADLPYDGLLFAAPAGTAVRAAGDGVVVHVGDEGTSHGDMIILEHEGGLLTIYGHLDELLVRAGERVTRGQTIAQVGTTGRAESPQLHFQVRSGRKPVDPLKHLPPP
jgi:murein DD-endopeptidase MepM/ murein hydrolase activator NlpD